MGKSEVENIKTVKNLMVFIKQYLKKGWLIARTKVTVG